MRKPAFCICENKDADQLRGNREADQHLCFRYIDSTIPLPLNPKFKASSLQPSLCRTWSETPKTGFLTTRLIFICIFKRHYCMVKPLDSSFREFTAKLFGVQMLRYFTVTSNTLFILLSDKVFTSCVQYTILILINAFGSTAFELHLSRGVQAGTSSVGSVSAS